jgi:hypothetical protein
MEKGLEVFLFNRDRAEVKLTETEKGSGIFKLSTGAYCFRVVGDVNNPSAVDPSGGPYISKGSEQVGWFINSDGIDEAITIKIKDIKYDSEKRAYYIEAEEKKE